ncbi:MAG: tetraacyldisaccharide 4'-kinase, partial [Rhodospirillales bacterium]|nr:tetraacyldisaccharide 4'-kinase [Rhodospirillales bacterium]
MRAPDFWYRRDGGLMPWMLTPLAAAYDFLGRARTAMTRAWRAPVPIVCVGN